MSNRNFTLAKRLPSILINCRYLIIAWIALALLLIYVSIVSALPIFAQNLKKQIDPKNRILAANNEELNFNEMPNWSKMEVAYKIYVGGIKVAFLDLVITNNKLEANSSDIHLSVSAKTAKIIDFFSAGRFKLTLNADWYGERREHNIKANNYLIEANFGRNGVINSRVIYNDLNIIDSWFHYNSAAPDRSEYKNYEFVTYDHVVESVDPLFAVTEFFIISSITETPCNYERNVFTGDHIDGISGKFVSRIEIDRSNYNSYHGSGFTCTWSAKPVAGFFLPSVDQKKTRAAADSKIDLVHARKYVENDAVSLDFSIHEAKLPTFLVRGRVKTKYATFHIVASSFSIWLGDQILSAGETN